MDELSLEELASLIEEKKAALATLLESEDLTDEQIAEGEELSTAIDEAVAAVEAKEQAAADRAAKVASLRTKVTASEAPPEPEVEEEEEEEEEPEEEPEPSPESSLTPTPTENGTKVTVAALARKSTRPKPPASRESRVTITAAADVPDFSTGQRLDDMSQVGNALVSRMRGFGEPSGDGSIENLQHYGVAKFKKDFEPELVIDPARGNSMEVLAHASNEARLSSDQGSGSLVAAGGWCAPSETLYDLCVTETLDGILSIPEVDASRGGIRFTKGPDFASIYSNVGFLQTEAQAISGTTKTCFEVPCPSFTDVRLDVIGLCIKAPILTNAAYPELVQRWLSGSMVAHAHKVNASVIGRIATAAGTANAVNDFGGTAQTTLANLEYLADRLRQKYKLGINDSLEVVLPYWVKGAMRSDLALRTGHDPSNGPIDDSLLMAHFTARKLNVQFVYDWQELADPATTEGYAATYQALIYPAGAFVKATKDVITLNAVYDAASLATNIYTALFFEEGLAVLNTCAEAMLVTLAVCNSGKSGIANVAQCGLGA